MSGKLVKYRLRVDIGVRPPVLSQGLGARRLGLDAAALRDRAEDRPAFPGTLIKGNLREAWEDFAQLNVRNGLTNEQINKWLGPPPKKPEDERNQWRGQGGGTRGRLLFDEFWVAKERAEAARVRHRIRIDPKHGAVVPGALQSIELPYAPAPPDAQAARVAFSGYVAFWGADTDVGSQEAEDLKRWIRKGLAYVPALGAYKGAGFGQIAEVEFELLQPVPPRHSFASLSEPGPSAAVLTVLGLRLILDRPFCFTRARVIGNLFVSEDYIPGAAIKGAMATRLYDYDAKQGAGELEVSQLVEAAKSWPSLCKHFDKLRVTHALPVPKDLTLRPVTAPLSLCYARADRGERLYDVALRSGAGLIHRSAPAFEPDWKDVHRRHALTACGWGAPPRRSLQVRNQIDRATGAVKKKQLFTVDAVRPEHHHWLANVHIPKDLADEERAALIDELEGFFGEGLDRLGKTRAEAKVTLTPEFRLAFPMRSLVEHDGRVVITLLSDARLPGACPPDMPPTNGGGALHTMYSDCWWDLSGELLKLKHFYACQFLVGGKYWWTRFGKDAGRPYNPELHTAAGSVFVFQVEPDQKKAAEEKLREWLATGLPQPAGPDDWRRNPYIGANGYGEIAVNLDSHWALYPPEGVWRELG